MQKFLKKCKAFLEHSQIILEGSDLDFYLQDERKLFRGKALCLLYPKTAGEIQSILKAAQETKTSVVAVGGNTGLCGAATPLADGDTALCSLAKMNRILKVDKEASTITVEAGATVQTVIEAAKEAGLLFPLRFGAQTSAQVGGVIATNAGGYSTIRYGNTSDLLLGVQAVMADGSIINQLKSLRKDNTGYNLAQLLCGSEGTLGIVTVAVFKLFPLPRDVQTALIAVKDIHLAIKVLGILNQQSDGRITAFEWMSSTATKVASQVEGVKNPYQNNPETKDLELLVVELTSYTENLKSTMLAALDSAREFIVDGLVAESKTNAESFWALRESIPQGEKLLGGSIKHDVSVPVSSVPDFIDAGRNIFEELDDENICAYGHLGDGNIHYNLIGVDTKTPVASNQYTQKIFDLVESFGGSFSAEHGIGQLRLDELKKRGDPGTLLAMKQIKAGLDPQNILNPGKVIAR